MMSLTTNQLGHGQAGAVHVPQSSSRGRWTNPHTAEHPVSQLTCVAMYSSHMKAVIKALDKGGWAYPLPTCNKKNSQELVVQSVCSLKYTIQSRLGTRTT